MKKPQEPSIYETVISLTKEFFSAFTFNGTDKTSQLVPDFDPKEVDNFVQNASTVMFIYNHQTAGYDYFSPNVKEVMGYESEQFKTGGLKFSMSLVHPDHTKIYNRYVLPIMFKYYMLYAIKGRVTDMRFSYTFKIKRASGEYMWALHHMCAVKTNRFGLPTHTSVHVSDITEFKSDDHINISVAVKDAYGVFKPVYSRIYAKDNTFTFSDRELEVLGLIAKGKTSKDISEELSLSVHTIIRHRKNMMIKAKVKNSSELVQLAYSHKNAPSDF